MSYITCDRWWSLKVVAMKHQRRTDSVKIRQAAP